MKEGSYGRKFVARHHDKIVSGNVKYSAKKSNDHSARLQLDGGDDDDDDFLMMILILILILPRFYQRCEYYFN